ncbi:unnamed protein product [Sphenostylis stenocarpa]|uniref:Uncharacterized protein n=1 Tax=Sphenostylis stenocarpa TaxID=92480 RepID=A0AA86VH66_9FABA|nr:unnamed protein product [Sphenostylis stenocarpa]
MRQQFLWAVRRNDDSDRQNSIPCQFKTFDKTRIVESSAKTYFTSCNILTTASKYEEV